MIDEDASVRVEGIIERAVKKGAKLIGGERLGSALLGAAILADVSSSMDATSEEIFGPVVTLQRYSEIHPVFDSISSSSFVLQCGVFTNTLSIALEAIRSLRTGGVTLNSTPRWRCDQSPYGGVKDSGIGREGPKYAIRDMTDERFIVLQ